MELMSSLLLCALLAIPQALGKVRYHTGDKDIKFNNSMQINQLPIMNQKVLLNVNGPPLVNVVSELQLVFKDEACFKCVRCMERAIRASKIDYRMRSTRLNPANNLINQFAKRNRNKRNTDVSNEIQNKKHKSDRNKNSNTVRVTKYNDKDGKIYALRVKETNTRVTSGERNGTKAYSTTCQVYNVKKSFPCDSPESDLISTISKSKANNKSKKLKDKNTLKVSTEKAKSIKAVFRKRELDSSQVLESFMPSVEESY